MRRILIVVAAVGALLLVGGVAYASIPGPDGVIHGCYKTTDGSARIIDSTATCPNGYTAINWSQTGPQGPAGTVPTPITVTRVARHAYASGAGASLPETVTCPTGKHAINGGVLQAEAVGWPQGGSSTNGDPSAIENTGYEVPSGPDPSMSWSLPRPVDGETGWRVLVVHHYPIVGGVYLDLDVTLFATCI